MSKTHWEHYSHPADIGIRGFGPSKEEAFAQAALALTAIVTDLQKIEPKQQVEISCQDQDDEFLFVDWLNAIIYEMATQQMLFSRFEVSVENERLSASAFGEKIDVKKHSPAVEVKAATYTDLKVRQNKNGNWVVQCVVDV
jgi:tRNA nucleotidyltransferase (CCA-adding enzyme)